MSAGHSPGQALGIGQILNDRYRIEHELGRGGMATIYLAVDLRLNDRRVVIKIPRMDMLGDARLRQRFLAEVRDLAQHEHPHILGIIDFGEHQGVPFAVLQYLGGGDLSARLRASGGRMSVREILQWLRPVALALDFIHAKGCLHRDVKSANIIFDEQGHPYLSDFGISTALDVIDSEAPTIAPQDQLTGVGTFVGSPAYAPPEAIDRLFTPAYDQYSLATIVYLALSGRLPYEAKTAEAILIAKSNTPPVPLAAKELKERLPVGCGHVVMRALSNDPADRFPSCRAFADALAAEAERRAPAHWGRAVALTAGVAALALGLALLWSRLPQWPPGPASPPGSDEGAGSTIATPVQVQLGSTASELADALALCRAYAEDCDPAEFEGERLRSHRVVPIEMDRFEVSNSEFARYVAETGLVTLAEKRGRSWDGPWPVSNRSWRRPSAELSAADHGDHPVVHVSFDEAEAFCAAIGKRLPTADEWEYQARGPERRIFPWGDDWSASRLRWSDDPDIGLEPVGSHPSGATPDGIQDLAGSVWEWTSDAEGELRKIKGASWNDRNPAYFRAAAFAEVERDHSNADLGFRCVRDR